MSRLDPHRSGKVTRASHVSRCPRTCVPRPCDAQPLGAMTHNTGKAILRALSYGDQSRDGLGTANTANFPAANRVPIHRTDGEHSGG